MIAAAMRFSTVSSKTTISGRRSRRRSSFRVTSETTSSSQAARSDPRDCWNPRRRRRSSSRSSSQKSPRRSSTSSSETSRSSALSRMTWRPPAVPRPPPAVPRPAPPRVAPRITPRVDPRLQPEPETTVDPVPRASGPIFPGETPRQAADRAIRRRWSSHDMVDEGYLPRNARFDRLAVQEGAGPNRSSAAYAAIRGREQFLIDYYGGAQSDVRNGVAGTSGNPDRESGAAIRGGSNTSLRRGPRYPRGPCPIALPNWP